MRLDLPGPSLSLCGLPPDEEMLLRLHRTSPQWADPLPRRLRGVKRKLEAGGDVSVSFVNFQGPWGNLLIYANA